MCEFCRYPGIIKVALKEFIEPSKLLIKIRYPEINPLPEPGI